MKKVWIVLLLICTAVMCGCGVQETLETIADDVAAFVPTDAAEVQLSFPEEVEVSIMESANGNKLYLCDGYSVTVQTMDGGDISKTLREISGYDTEKLTVMKTVQKGTACYESAWSTVGEKGDQSCRTVILDDGTYHYAVTVMADYAQAGQMRETWEKILNSVWINTD